MSKAPILGAKYAATWPGVHLACRAAPGAPLAVQAATAGVIGRAETLTLEAADSVRLAAKQSLRFAAVAADAADTDYIFLTFITQNLPVGLVGALLASIFCAAMSATASGLNSLASTAVIDIWKRLLRKDQTDHEYVTVSRWMTIGWGAFCIAFALYANQLGSGATLRKLGFRFWNPFQSVPPDSR